MGQPRWGQARITLRGCRLQGPESLIGQTWLSFHKGKKKGAHAPIGVAPPSGNRQSNLQTFSTALTTSAGTFLRTPSRTASSSIRAAMQQLWNENGSSRSCTSRQRLVPLCLLYTKYFQIAGRKIHRSTDHFSCSLLDRANSSIDRQKSRTWVYTRPACDQPSPWRSTTQAFPQGSSGTCTDAAL